MTNLQRPYQGPVLWSHAFRPFFLFGGGFAAAALPVWLIFFSFGEFIPVQAGALHWHAHEMLFGYLGAVMTGFLFTAIPNWTGRLPLRGAALMMLFGLWFAGRIIMFIPWLPELYVKAVDAAFLVVVAAVVWREILAGKNWRNLPVCLLVSVFAFANILWHWEAVFGLAYETGLRLGLAMAAMLIAVIGGRIIPSFTLNWMKKAGLVSFPTAFNSFDKIVLAATFLALILWIVAPLAWLTGVILISLGCLHFYRLARWHGWRCFSEPMVVILHIGYAWLALAFLLLGGAILQPTYMPHAASLHGLTAGAIAVMTMAVMTRASLGHTGRTLTATRGIAAIYWLVNLGAVLRLLAVFFPEYYIVGVTIAGLLWSFGFALFVVIFAPILSPP